MIISRLLGARGLKIFWKSKFLLTRSLLRLPSFFLSFPCIIVQIIFYFFPNVFVSLCEVILNNYFTNLTKLPSTQSVTMLP